SFSCFGNRSFDLVAPAYQQPFDRLTLQSARRRRTCRTNPAGPRAHAPSDGGPDAREHGRG
ncbi:MAG: hypothetical protein WBP67_14755, partial [Thermoanaerobaculia bacterium]